MWLRQSTRELVVLRPCGYLGAPTQCCGLNRGATLMPSVVNGMRQFWSWWADELKGMSPFLRFHRTIRYRQFLEVSLSTAGIGLRGTSGAGKSAKTKILHSFGSL